MKFEDLAIGSMYRLSYLDNYEEIVEFRDVKITGVTDVSNYESYVDKSIFEIYFAPLGKTISDYLKVISKSNKVYLVDFIDSRDPFEIGDQGVIPQFVIDMANIEKYIELDKISIKIDGMKKDLNTAFETGTYLNKLTADISNKLSELRQIGDLPLSIGFDRVDIISNLDEYNRIEDNIQRSFDITDKVKIAERNKNEEYTRAIIDKSNRLATAKETAERKTQELETVMESFTIAKDSYDSKSAIIETGKGRLFDLFAGLENGTIMVSSDPASVYMVRKSQVLNDLGIA